jgi:DNA-directed RNA polymerase subunit M/transcription elongation factor TFIIS
MILNETLKVKCSSRNITQFRKNNPELKIGDKVEIPIFSLTKGSKQLILVKCDKCGLEKEMMYKDYNRITNNQKTLYFCHKCKWDKTKETNLERYGVVNVFQSDLIKEKIKDTNLEKYQVEFFSQSLGYKERIKKTNLEKYGVEYPMQNEAIKNKSLINKKINVEKQIQTTRANYSVIFLEKAKKTHGDFYDYSKVNYFNMETKVKIICKHHGVFEQRPKDHIHAKQGCPICKQSKGEREIRNFLLEHRIEFEDQKTFEDCKFKSLLPFDFYLPAFNLCIEYDGIQHYEPINYFGGKLKFEEIKERDRIKNGYCQEKEILLLRIGYYEEVIKILKDIFYDSNSNLGS